ncbi:hypothetical protein BGP78_11055 [Pseudoalteromonas sp. MSK9-3]|uniref:hypothetical protein n=1 Tax=Pseudoalteromonas sp. MSK9-3 TaxID=1897633 RepID=UPI000E6C2D97|nr:hypothetical protein [Pseudoalteromonas sp. MSK9-3]RJE76532.1 hypothetical protein BGP78_11055 [Pseudoalteromonas sp. MSK9-3]
MRRALGLALLCSLPTLSFANSDESGLMEEVAAACYKMRATDWFDEPSMGSDNKLAQQTVLSNEYEQLRLQLEALNPNYAQNTQKVDISGRAAKPFNDVITYCSDKMAALKRYTRELAELKVTRAEAERIRLEEEAQAKADKEYAAQMAAQDLDVKLTDIAAEHGYDAYIGSIRAFYQKHYAGASIDELAEYAMVPAEDAERYTMQRVIGDYAIYQGTDDASPHTRLIALEKTSDGSYGQYARLPLEAYVVLEKKTFKTWRGGEKEILVFGRAEDHPAGGSFLVWLFLLIIAGGAGYHFREQLLPHLEPLLNKAKQAKDDLETRK